MLSPWRVLGMLPITPASGEALRLRSLRDAVEGVEMLKSRSSLSR